MNQNIIVSAPKRSLKKKTANVVPATGEGVSPHHGEKAFNKTIHVQGSYSEQTLRTAAAWAVDPRATFNLRSTEQAWEIETDDASQDLEQRFFRYLNDIRLRELIDQKTNNLRTLIVERALKNIYSLYREK